MEKEENSEFHSQNLVVRHIRRTYGGCLLFTASLGGHLHKKEHRWKASHEGYTPGTPDLIIFHAKCGFNGLCIEMKRQIRPGRGKTRVQPNQAQFINSLRENGYCARVCYGSAQAIRLIDAYMANDTSTVLYESITNSGVADTDDEEDEEEEEEQPLTGQRRRR